MTYDTKCHIEVDCDKDLNYVVFTYTSLINVYKDHWRVYAMFLLSCDTVRGERGPPTVDAGRH